MFSIRITHYYADPDSGPPWIQGVIQIHRLKDEKLSTKISFTNIVVKLTKLKNGKKVTYRNIFFLISFLIVFLSPESGSRRSINMRSKYETMTSDSDLIYFCLFFTTFGIFLSYPSEEKEREVVKLTHAQKKLSNEQGARKDKTKLTIF